MYGKKKATNSEESFDGKPSRRFLSMVLAQPLLASLIMSMFFLLPPSRFPLQTAPKRANVLATCQRRKVIRQQ
jgi:hypothetical protein